MLGGNSRSVVANVINWDIVLSEFELRSHCYVDFGLIFQAKEWNYLCYIARYEYVK